MNPPLALAYIQGIKIACEELGYSPDQVQEKLAILGKLKALFGKAPALAQAAAHVPGEFASHIDPKALAAFQAKATNFAPAVAQAAQGAAQNLYGTAHIPRVDPAAFAAFQNRPTNFKV